MKQKIENQAIELIMDRFESKKGQLNKNQSLEQSLNTVPEKIHIVEIKKGVNELDKSTDIVNINFPVGNQSAHTQNSQRGQDTMRCFMKDTMTSFYQRAINYKNEEKKLIDKPLSKSVRIGMGGPHTLS